ncbi:MAG: hypothetical protein Q9M91_07595 [Candidatus Dojkabacteria bacterium]|nr:hypothetical protein [Candidatus Dojkabacteria bacterium]
MKRIEDKLEDLKNKMFNLGDDFEKIEKISIKVKELESELELKTNKWLEIAS